MHCCASFEDDGYKIMNPVADRLRWLLVSLEHRLNPRFQLAQETYEIVRQAAEEIERLETALNTTPSKRGPFADW